MPDPNDKWAARLKEGDARKRLREEIAGSSRRKTPIDPPSPPPHPPSMDGERLGRLEAAVEALRHSQNLTVAATLGVGAILAAFIIGFGVYGLQRIDAIDARVNALPGQISADLRDISRTLAASITAAKQSPPAVIYIPTAPAPPK